MTDPSTEKPFWLQAVLFSIDIIILLVWKLVENPKLCCVYLLIGLFGPAHGLPPWIAGLLILLAVCGVVVGGLHIRSIIAEQDRKP